MKRLFKLFLISVFSLLLASCSEENIDANHELYGIWENTQVVNDNVMTTQLIFGKALVGKINRIEDSEGFYVRDVIALVDEDVNSLISEGEKANPLLVKVIENGSLVYDLPSLEEISKTREREMSKFRDIDNYSVVRSKGVEETQESIESNIQNQYK